MSDYLFCAGSMGNVLNIGTVTSTPSPLVVGQNIVALTLPITPTTSSIVGSAAASLTVIVTSGYPFCHSGTVDATTTVGGCTWTVISPVRGGSCANMTDDTATKKKVKNVFRIIGFIILIL